jgi:hypothetical protein
LHRFFNFIEQDVVDLKLNELQADSLFLKVSLAASSSPNSAQPDRESSRLRQRIRCIAPACILLKTVPGNSMTPQQNRCQRHAFCHSDNTKAILIPRKKLQPEIILLDLFESYFPISIYYESCLENILDIP